MKSTNTDTKITTENASDRKFILIERGEQEVRAMSDYDRTLTHMNKWFYKPSVSCSHHDRASTVTNPDVEAQQCSEKKQFKIVWQKRKIRKFGKCSKVADICRHVFYIGETMNNTVIRTLNWCLQSSFTCLIFMFIVVFFSLTVGFAIILWIESDRYPECLSTKKDESYWQDSFALSWTTFSTVGYGHIYPSLVNDNNQSTSCGWIISTCAVEALVGVLYAGVCAAILFAKIYRVQACATVVFSKAITIEYGGIHETVEESKKNYESDQSYEDYLGFQKDGSKLVEKCQQSSKFKLPMDEKTLGFPVMSIKMVNTLANKSDGGELINAEITGVVTKASKKSNVSRKSGMFRRKKKLIKKNTLKAISSVNYFDHLKFVDSSHYLFNRVWVVHHVLDETSPLLKMEVRERIKNARDNKIMEQKKSGGHQNIVTEWPADLASAEKIRESLEPFENIVISLKAISNSSATVVYAHQVYDYKSSVVVGYEHVDDTYVDSDTKAICVDFELVDDVVEIEVGEAEDLSSCVSLV